MVDAGADDGDGAAARLYTTVIPASGNDCRCKTTKTHGREPVSRLRLPVAIPSKVTSKNNSTRSGNGECLRDMPKPCRFLPGQASSGSYTSSAPLARDGAALVGAVLR